MRTKLYITFDRVAGMLLGTIIRCNNDEVARRSFHDSLRHPDSPLKGHEADYDLLYLGELDENTGAIEPLDIRPVIARGADWLEANKEGTK